MDFSLLQQQLQEDNSQAVTDRQAISLEAYQQGIECLVRAHASDYRDKEALKQASEHLITSIRYGRYQAEAYVMMAYLLLLLNDQIPAIRYLKEALRLDPTHKDAQALLEYIRNPQGEKTFEDGNSLSLLEKIQDNLEETTNIQSEDLYESTQALIRKNLARIQAIHWQPALDSDAFRHLDQHYQALEKMGEELNQRLPQLEMEMSVTDLRHMARPLELTQDKLQKLRIYSNRLLRLLKEIEQMTEKIQQDCLKYRSASPELEQKVEYYVNECDRFADVLDEAESQDYQIPHLVSAYDQLVAKVEQLDDILDA